MKPAISPAVYKAHQLTADWIKHHQLVNNDAMLHYYQDQKFAWMTARFYPHCHDVQRITALNYLYTLLFICDDMLEKETAFKDRSNLKTFVAGFMQVMKNRVTILPGQGIPILSALSDVWLQLCALTSSSWQQHFVDEIIKMFEGALWEQSNTAGKKYATLQDYFSKRQYLGAANIATEAIEAASEHLCLPAAVQQHPDVRKMINICRDTVCYANDLFSLAKELEQGHESNLVLVIKHEYGFSLEEAIAEGVRIHDEEVKEFFTLAGKVLVYDASVNTRLREYCDALAAIMRGNIDWSVQETQRYYGFSYATRQEVKQPALALSI